LLCGEAGDLNAVRLDQISFILEWGLRPGTKMVGLQAGDFSESDPNHNGSHALLALIYLRTA
jgi:hypothetical protein